MTLLNIISLHFEFFENFSMNRNEWQDRQSHAMIRFTETLPRGIADAQFTSTLKLVESLERKRARGEWTDHLAARETNAAYGDD